MSLVMNILFGALVGRLIWTLLWHPSGRGQVAHAREMLGPDQESFRVTEENLEEAKARYQGLIVYTRKRCPECQSYLVGWHDPHWEYDTEGKRLRHCYSVHITCPSCRRLTVEDPWTPDNDNPSLSVIPNAVGWVLCPNCGKRFALSNNGSWNGERHLTCGQSLSLPAA
jgi:hypothetical protein